MKKKELDWRYRCKVCGKIVKHNKVLKHFIKHLKNKDIPLDGVYDFFDLIQE